MKKFRSGQSTLEYAFAVAIIAAACLAMQFYMKRSVEGRLKQAGDEISEPYDSELMESSAIVNRVNSNTTVGFTVVPQGNDTYSYIQRVDQHETVNRSGHEHLNPW
jgi:hypothetical protein